MFATLPTSYLDFSGIKKKIIIRIYIKSDGWTAFYCLSVHYKHGNLFDLIQLLIKKGVDVKWKGLDGTTHLDLFHLRNEQHTV